MVEFSTYLWKSVSKGVKWYGMHDNVRRSFCLSVQRTESQADV